MAGTLGRCHGFTGRPGDPSCYHPGPGILPVWASDLAAWVIVVLIIGVLALVVRKIARY
jgi:hypothetical protein